MTPMLRAACLALLLSGCESTDDAPQECDTDTDTDSDTDADTDTDTDTDTDSDTDSDTDADVQAAAAAMYGPTWYTDIRQLIIYEIEGGAEMTAALETYFEDQTRFAGKNYAPTDPPVVGLGMRDRVARSFAATPQDEPAWLGDDHNWGFYTYALDLDTNPPTDVLVALAATTTANSGTTTMSYDDTGTHYEWQRTYNDGEVEMDFSFTLGDCTNTPAAPGDGLAPIIPWDNADGNPTRTLHYRRTDCAILDPGQSIDNTNETPTVIFDFGEDNQLLADTFGAPHTLKRANWYMAYVVLPH